MYNLNDVSMTMDLGEVLDEEEAIMVLHEEGLAVGIMSGYLNGEYFEKRVTAPFCEEVD